jgi:hypothetical protein
MYDLSDKPSPILCLRLYCPLGGEVRLVCGVQ